MQQLPKIALGTWSWGTGVAGGDAVFGNNLTEAQMQEVFDAAMAEGLNLWDTAYVYGMGSSETELGRLVRRYAKGSVIVSTKFTPDIADENAENPVQTMLEGSLQRLGTEFIDIYWIHNAHNVERWTPMLIPLLQSGQVKAVGVSNHNLAQIKRANEILGGAGFKISAVHNHYSLRYRHSEESGVLDYCTENGIKFFAYMVLEQGALSGRYSPQNPLPQGSQRAETYNKILPQLEKLTDAMAKIGAPFGASAAQVAVAWAIAKGTLPIIGATKIHHVTDAAKAAQIALLTENDMTTLEKLAQETGVNTRGGWEEQV